MIHSRRSARFRNISGVTACRISLFVVVYSGGCLLVVTRRGGRIYGPSGRDCIENSWLLRRARGSRRRSDVSLRY